MKKLTFIILGAIVALSSCNKEKDKPKEDPAANPTTSSISLMCNYGMDALVIGNEYTNHNGKKIIFTRADFYLSKIRFEDMSMNTESIPNEYQLVKGGTGMQEFDLGEVSAGHKHMLKFGVGVDAEANNVASESDFLALPSTDPLSAKSPSMHWAWGMSASLYKFIVLEGTFDKDGDQTIDPLTETFEYHIATNSMYREISFMIHKDFTESTDNEIILTVDFKKMLEGVDMESTPMGHGNAGPNTTIADSAVVAITSGGHMTM